MPVRQWLSERQLTYHPVRCPNNPPIPASSWFGMAGGLHGYTVASVVRWRMWVCIGNKKGLNRYGLSLHALYEALTTTYMFN
mgnify:CR=1 FL=1